MNLRYEFTEHSIIGLLFV